MLYNNSKKYITASREQILGADLVLYLLAFMLPCVQPFMSGEDWKEVLPCACCIMGLWAWPTLGDMRGLWGVAAPPNPLSDCWLIPDAHIHTDMNGLNLTLNINKSATNYYYFITYTHIQTFSLNTHINLLHRNDL